MQDVQRAVVYARVSTEDQARHGYSLQTQVEQCREYAEQQGWTIVDDVIDDGISGAKLDRPGLDRVRDMAQAGEFEILVVYDLDRFSRRAVHQMILEEELKKAGVSVRYVLGRYDDTDEGRLQKGIRAQIAEYERAKIRERMMRGQRAKARSGKVVGLGPVTFGYTFEDGYYLINEAEARVVRDIYEWYLQGVSIREIIRKLDRRGVRTRRGNTTWSRGSIYRVLSNETYAGTRYFNRRKTQPDGSLGWRDQSEWITIEVPAIVNHAEWEAVQARKERNQQVMRRLPRHEYLLRGVLRCKACNRTYGGQCSGRYHYYRDGGQKHRSLRAEVIEGAVWGAVERMILDHDYLLADWQKRQAEAGAEREEIERKLDECKALRNKAIAKIENLTATYIDPDVTMSKGEYVKAREVIQREMAAYEKDCNKLRQQLATEVITREQIQSLESFAAQLSGRLDVADFAAKRKVLNDLQIQGEIVWLDDDTASISFTGEIRPEDVCISLRNPPISGTLQDAGSALPAPPSAASS